MSSARRLSGCFPNPCILSDVRSYNGAIGRSTYYGVCAEKFSKSAQIYESIICKYAATQYAVPML